MFHVYILELANRKFYIGQTSNLEKRLVRHQTGQVQSTKGFRPLELVYWEKHGTRSEATMCERYLKLLKRHKALQELINTFDGPIV